MRAMQHLARYARRLAIQVLNIGSVCEQPSLSRKVREQRDRWKLPAKCKVCNELRIATDERR
jgi:hypothetical protein